MFDTYEYLLRKSEGSDVQVYRATGLSRMEELIRDMRETRFPCVMVDVGTDGSLDLSRGCYNREYHTIYILDSAETCVGNINRISEILRDTFGVGKNIMTRMQSESFDISQPCYGFDPASITYSAVGPVGLHCYGYAFNFVMNRDHER